MRTLTSRENKAIEETAMLEAENKWSIFVTFKIEDCSR